MYIITIKKNNETKYLAASHKFTKWENGNSYLLTDLEGIFLYFAEGDNTNEHNFVFNQIERAVEVAKREIPEEDWQFVYIHRLGYPDVEDTKLVK